MATPDRAKPEYRAWQQKIRGRAARRLQHTHPNDWRTLLTEEQTADPYTPPKENPPCPKNQPPQTNHSEPHDEK